MTRTRARPTLTALALTLALLAGCTSPPRHVGPERDVTAVMQVVEAFRMALIRKDKPAYMALFFSARPQDIGWQSVVDDAQLAVVRRERPQAIKARPRPDNNFVALIDGIVASPVPEEERIENLVIDTDGEIATAAFDYAYLADGKVSNRGREYWQLVRTEQGWKIFSVVYSIRAG